MCVYAVTYCHLSMILSEVTKDVLQCRQSTSSKAQFTKNKNTKIAYNRTIQLIQQLVLLLISDWVNGILIKGEFQLQRSIPMTYSLQKTEPLKRESRATGS